MIAARKRGGADPPPERDAAEIRTAIEDARNQIKRSVVALREEACLALTWRHWFRRRPALFLGAAFALGFLVGVERRP